jgi:thiamine-phosphate pyrophosphorylase
MRLVLPKLYVILDAALIPSDELELALKLADAGVRLLQYRNKSASPRKVFETAKRLASHLVPRGVSFIVNDRPDIAALAGATGVHVGQDDLDAEAARRVVGTDKWVGVSTHNLEQFQSAVGTSADYIAVGPIFPTDSKTNPDATVGIEFIRKVRSLTEKPIVAIGGITLENAAQVMESGADSVAVISDILRAPNPVERTSRYLTLLDAAKHAAV